MSRLGQHSRVRLPELRCIQLGATPDHSSTPIVRPSHNGCGANREDPLDIPTRNGHPFTTIHEYEV